MLKLSGVIFCIALVSFIVLMTIISINGSTTDRIDLAGDFGKIGGATGGLWLVLKWEAWRRQKEGKAVSAKYGWFIFSLVCFAVCAAAIIFQMALAATGAPENFPQNGRYLVGVVIAAIGAKRSWSNVLQLEPEVNASVVRKHRVFLTKAIALVLLAFVATGSIGTALGVRNSKRDSLFAEISALGAKTAPIKQRFMELVRKDSKTVPDYLQRCTDLESTLDQYEPALHQMDSLLSQMQDYIKNDAAGLETLSTTRSILQKDLEGASALRKEIANAKLLANMPAAEQLGFYDEKIKPIEAEELRIANEELEIMRGAQARGVKLSQQMYKDAGIK